MAKTLFDGEHALLPGTIRKPEKCQICETEPVWGIATLMNKSVIWLGSRCYDYLKRQDRLLEPKR